MIWLRILAGALFAGAVIGVLAAVPVSLIALDHNPQGEFADPASGIWTPALYAQFGWTALVVGGPVSAAVMVAGLFVQLLRRSD